ncbi:MAG: biosynthetic-type acetolactate synthase large subunit [Muribaculaceae bacterium]|nr:biosynthetic-type acetolactate synthase large subunit [Muribaculaceae bacterium]
MNETITGAEALMRGLVAEGVDRVFGYPGGFIIPVYDRLYDYADRITHVLTRHEQGAIHAAQGYARASHRTGVVIVTSGPAATNLITGLSDAMMDSTPLVVITGQAPSHMLGTDAFQETDVIGITQPVTKWSCQVREAFNVGPVLARAFHIASTGRPGPVVIDLTRDAQTGLTDSVYEKCRFIRSYTPYPAINRAHVKRVADLINSARRPMILAGQGITISEAEDRLRALAEKASIPVAFTMLGLSALPSGHPLNMGMLGMHGNIAPNVNTNRADLIIAIGMRFDDRVTGDVDSYARQAQIVHIDIDESEFNKNIRVNATVHGDASEVLDMLLPLIEPRAHDEWIASFREHQKVEREEVMESAAYPTAPDEPMRMGEMARKVSEAAGEAPILVTDVGQNQLLSARYFRYSGARSIITSGGLGTMGFGLPAAIGAKMGAPERQVCLFCGDGGIQMTIQELGTIMQYGTAVKIVILNNNFLGNVRQWQALFYDSRFSQTPMLNPDFVTIAKAYGIPAEDVSRRADADAAIDRMMKHDGPYMLNVNIREDDMVFPMTPAGEPVDLIFLDASRRYSPKAQQL